MKLNINVMKNHFAFLLMLGVNLTNAHAASLCEKSEEVAFACDFLNQKSVAVCKGKHNDIEYLEYRYGRRENIEMKFKATEGDKKKKFHRAEVVYASNASEVVWFQNGNFFYMIHLPMREGPLLDVVRGGKTIGHQTCKGGWAGVQNNLEKANKFAVDHGSGSIDAMEPLWSNN